jgi:hypothetical protein
MGREKRSKFANDAKSTADLASSLAQNTTELSNKVKLVKFDNEGQYPAPFRVPVFSIENKYPNIRSPFTPLWVEGSTIYAIASDLTLRKSTDGGETWVNKGYNNQGFSSTRCFLKLSTGTLLTVSSGNKILRSTDDGLTWDAIFTYRTGTMPLGSQSWAVDKQTGYIYMGEYWTTAQDQINIYRSMDDGLTWQIFFTFNTTGSGIIKHIHALQWDHVDKRIVICAGDATDYTGLWRVNVNGDGLEKIVTNDMLPPELIDSPRCIGIMPFTNYIVWASDSTSNPYLFRMARNQIGLQNPTIERIYRLNSTAWFTCKASTDGSRWVFSSSEEANSLDDLVHLYAVEDEGKTVWELGAITSGGAATCSLMPVGLPENHGDDFYLISRNFGTYVWKFRSGKGFNSISKPEPMPKYLVPQTFNTPQPITLTPGQDTVIGYTLPAAYAKRIYILEASIVLIDAGGVSGGYQRLIVRKMGSASTFEYTKESARYDRHIEFGNEIDSASFTGGNYIEIAVKNTHGAATIKVMASLTFAWGE